MILKLNSENFSRIIRELIIERSTFSLRSAEEGIVTIDVDKSSSGLALATNVKKLPIDLTTDLQRINAAILIEQSRDVHRLYYNTEHLGCTGRLKLVDLIERHGYTCIQSKTTITIKW